MTKKIVEDATDDLSLDILESERARLFGVMRDHILDYLKHESGNGRWTERTEAEQRGTINRTEAFCRQSIREIVRAIAADGRKVMIGKLEQVTVKDGLKAVLQLSRSDEQRHHLVDAQGSEIMVVVSDAADFMGGEEVAITPDQQQFIDDDHPVFDNTAFGARG